MTAVCRGCMELGKALSRCEGNAPSREAEESSTDAAGAADGLVVMVKLLLGVVGVERRAGRCVTRGLTNQEWEESVSGPRSEAASKPFELSKVEVWAAWERVRGDRGAAGVDAVELSGFENRLGDNLYRVWNRVASGLYFPPPVRSVEIPKPDGGVKGLGHRRSLTGWRRRWPRSGWRPRASRCFMTIVRVPARTVSA